ncbi:MAG: phosphatase PAP2 family protein [Anaerovoracaceae bacterium]
MLQSDQNILLWIQEYWRNDCLSPAVIFITKLGTGAAVWIVISVILLIPRKTRKVALLALAALLAAYVIDNLILKNLVARPRPYDVIPGLHSLIGAQNDYSFPSGHAGSSFAAAVVLFNGLSQKYSWVFLVLAALISLSRLYVGVHYPTDVLCGALIGINIGLFIYSMGMNISKRTNN